MQHSRPKTIEEFSCKKTIWKLYYLAPSFAWFSIQVLSESSNTILNSLGFSKNNESEKKSGESSLHSLIEQIYHSYGADGYAICPKITCEFIHKFACVYSIKVYVND